MFWLKNQSILIRADANPKIGTRSVNRCLSLANTLRKTGTKVNFVCSQVPAILARQISDLGCGLYLVDRDADVDREIRNLKELLIATNASWMIVDGVRFGEEYLRQLTLNGTRLRSIPTTTRLLNNDEFEAHNGPLFVIDSFGSRSSNHFHKRIFGKIRRVAIAIDGPDPHNITAQTISALDGLPKLTVDVFADTNNRFGSEIESAISESDHNFRVQRNVDRMASQFWRADIAISNVETCFHDIMTIGVPAILFREVPESRSQRVVNDVGHALTMDIGTNSSEIAKQIKSLARDRNLRERLSQSAVRLIDGQGADRLTRLIFAESFSLRTPEIEDADLLLQWRNDPELRAICFHQDQIKDHSHETWLAEKIQSNSAEFKIIEDADGRPVGQFRLDYELDQNACRLNISLIPSLRGQGLGTAFIEYACRMAGRRHPGVEVFANIKSNNIATQSAFRKAGFDATSTTTINGNVAIRFTKTIGRNFNSQIQYRKAS